MIVANMAARCICEIQEDTEDLVLIVVVSSKVRPLVTTVMSWINCADYLVVVSAILLCTILWYSLRSQIRIR